MHTDLTRVALYDELLACVTDQHLVSDTDSVQAASIEYNTSAKHDYESMLKSLIFNFRGVNFQVEIADFRADFLPIFFQNQKIKNKKNKKFDLGNFT